jgi:small subunit ribosomal protein S20
VSSPPQFFHAGILTPSVACCGEIRCFGRAEYQPSHHGKSMANTKSAKKANRKITRRTAINKGRRTRVRTALRSIEDAIKTGDQATAQAALKSAEPALMRAAQKGVMHKSTASRKVSRLTKRVAKLAQ